MLSQAGLGLSSHMFVEVFSRDVCKWRDVVFPTVTHIGHTPGNTTFVERRTQPAVGVGDFSTLPQFRIIMCL